MREIGRATRGYRTRYGQPAMSSGPNDDGPHLSCAVYVRVVGTVVGVCET